MDWLFERIKSFLKIVVDENQECARLVADSERFRVETKTNKMQNLLRTSLKTAIRDLREIKADKSVSMLLGQGFTIAVKGSILTIIKRDGGWSFHGSWNRGAHYWTQEVATKGAAELQPHTPLDLEVIHYNDIRDRHEKAVREMVCTLFKHRHNPALA
jgi:hypothetical protein